MKAKIPSCKAKEQRPPYIEEARAQITPTPLYIFFFNQFTVHLCCLMNESNMSQTDSATK